MSSDRLPGTAGRPRKIPTPEIFDALVDQYVIECETKGKGISISGLCLFLGFNSRQSLHDYSHRPGFEDFADSVKRAKLICENYLVEQTMAGAGAGPIFLLKASYGYVDRQQTDVKGEIKVVMTEKDAQL